MPKKKSPGTFVKHRLNTLRGQRIALCGDLCRQLVKRKLKVTRSEFAEILGIGISTSYEPQWKEHFAQAVKAGIIFHPTKARWRTT